MARLGGIEIQFQRDDQPDTRLEKLRRLAAAVESLERAQSQLGRQAISDVNLRDSLPCSVMGRATNTVGAPADILSATNNTVLRRVGDVLAFGTITSGFTSDFAPAAQNAVGSIFSTALEIAFSYDPITPQISASLVPGSVLPTKLSPGSSLQLLRTVAGAAAWQTVSPVLTLGADLSGNSTFTNLGNATLSATIVNNAVTDIKLRDSLGLSVIGRSATTTGDPADIIGATDQVLRVDSAGTTLGFGTITTGGLAASSVTNAKLADMAQSTIKGRAEAVGTGPPIDLTPTQVAAIIDGEAINWGALHTFAANLRLQSSNPRLLVSETGLAADTGLYDLNLDSGSFALRTRTDADGAGVNIFSTTRTSGTSLVRTFVGLIDSDPIGVTTTSGAQDNFGVLISQGNGSTPDQRVACIGAGVPGFNCVRYGTSVSSPAALATAQTIGDLGFFGYNPTTTTLIRSGRIRAVTNALWTGTSAPTSITLTATPSGTLTGVVCLEVNGSQILGVDGTAGLPGQSWIADPDTGRYRIGADNIGDSTGGVLRWSMSTTAITAALPLSVTGNLTLAAAGNGLAVKEGTNAAMGVATLVLGTVVVNNTRVTATSRIQLTAQSLGTVTVPTALAVTARTAGTSFTILSSNLTDTSVVAWHIFEPAP